MSNAKLATFAVDKDLDFVDSYVLGWILILGGILSIVLGFFMQAQKNRSTTVVEERRYDQR